MTARAGAGRCVLIDGSTAEMALLGELPGLERASSAELDHRLAAEAGPVDLLVLGSLAPSPVSSVQRVHRLTPDAAVAVLTADPAAVRRQASFAPGVPLDLLIAGIDEPGLVHRLRSLRDACIERRRHAAVLAAVLRRSAATTGAETSGIEAVGALLDHAPLAALLATASGETLGWNRRAEDLFGVRPDAAGRPVEDILPGALSAVTATVTSPADAPEEPVQVSIADRIVELHAVSSQTADGRPVVLLLAFDVTAHREAELERDRLAGQVQLLGRVSEALMGRLDVERPLSRLTDALVPALADWVSVQMWGDGHLRHVTLRHRDPALEPVTRAAEQVKRAKNCFTEPSRRAAGGGVVLLPTIEPRELPGLVPDPDLRSLVEQLGMSSVAAAPIPGRSGVLGSMLLARGPHARAFDEAELALAVEIGRRAGIALDNARLYAAQRELATELQQSLLTEPPALPFADIAVRYVAAGREAQVGGDWYDAFRRRDGNLVIAIGDVVGHDSRAAAAMGQLRGILRGIAFSTAERPDQVLTAVDEAIDGLELSTYASAVVAELSPPTTDHGGTSRLRWSNAGHPAPVVLDPDGRARLLEPSSGKADLLLGVDTATRRTTEQCALTAGCLVLLYTDGLVERRGESLDDGTNRLLRLVEQHADDPPDRLCDAIVQAMVPQAADDDIAIVAVRLLPSGDS